MTKCEKAWSVDCAITFHSTLPSICTSEQSREEHSAGADLLKVSHIVMMNETCANFRLWLCCKFLSWLSHQFNEIKIPEPFFPPSFTEI